MGQVLRREAAAADIFADATSTLEKARALDETWSAIAIAKLEAPLTLAKSVAERLRAAEDAAAPANAALEARTIRPMI